MSVNDWRLRPDEADGRLRCGAKVIEQGVEKRCGYHRFGFENPSARPREDWPSFGLFRLPAGTIEIRRDDDSTQELTEVVMCTKCGSLYDQEAQFGSQLFLNNL